MTASADMIIERHPLVNRFISPNEVGSYNPAAYVAGIVKGMLDAASFVRDTVQRHARHSADLPSSTRRK